MKTTIILTIDDLNALRHGEVIDRGEIKIMREMQSKDEIPNLAEMPGKNVFYPLDRFHYRGKLYEAFSHWSIMCNGCALYDNKKCKQTSACLKLACKRYDRTDGDNIRFREVKDEH